MASISVHFLLLVDTQLLCVIDYIITQSRKMGLVINIVLVPIGHMHMDYKCSVILNYKDFIFVNFCFKNK